MPIIKPFMPITKGVIAITKLPMPITKGIMAITKPYMPITKFKTPENNPDSVLYSHKFFTITKIFEEIVCFLVDFNKNGPHNAKKR